MRFATNVNKMSTKRIITLISSILVVSVVLVVIYSLKYEIPKPETWSANVKVYRRSLGGETSVFDADSGKLLFTYGPEYDLNVHPIRVDKIDPNHWQVVFKDPRKE